MKLRSPLDPETIPDEWLLERLRIHRDARLAASDWTQVSDAPVDREAWAAYRQALRDFPATWEPSEVCNFPLAPGETEPIEEETSGERSASDNVEEEGSQNDPIPDSGSAPSLS
jgi:hypothetical protein